MKRRLISIFVLTIAFTLPSCGKTDESADSDKSTESTRIENEAEVLL